MGGEHRVVEPEGPRLVELLRGARGADDGAPGGAAELHRGGAHPGADRLHEQHLARLHRGLRDQRVVSGDELLGDAARGDQVDRVGDRHALRRRHREQLGLTAATGDAEHPRRRAAGSVTPSPCATTSPANSSPGMSAGEPGGAW